MNNLRNDIIREFENEGMEVIDWTLYDSQFIATASGVNNLIFFQQTVGQVAGGRQRTNMKNSGQLPAPENFLIEEIWFQFVNASGLALQFDATNHDHPVNVFIAKGFFDFKREPATFLEGHFTELFSQMGEQTFDAVAPASVVAGVNSVWGKLYLRKPIILGTARHFEMSAQLTAPAAGDGYSASDTLLYCYLRGRKRRNR